MRKRLLAFFPSLLAVSLLTQAQANPPNPALQTRVHQVYFQGVTALPIAAKSQLGEQIHDLTPVPGRNALSMFARDKAMAAYADRGYWRAQVQTEVLSAGPELPEEVNVLIKAVQEGPAYRLEEIRWSGINAFTDGELSRLIALHKGDTLQRASIADGLEAARRLYTSHGYLNYSAVPEVETDDAQRTATLLIHVEEGGQFRVQKVDVVGVAAPVRARLLKEWPLKAGDIYPENTVEDFLRAHASLVANGDLADAVCRTLNLTNHTVDFVIDFRTPPDPCGASAAAEDPTLRVLNLPESHP